MFLAVSCIHRMYFENNTENVRKVLGVVVIKKYIILNNYHYYCYHNMNYFGTFLFLRIFTKAIKLFRLIRPFTLVNICECFFVNISVT